MVKFTRIGIDVRQPGRSFFCKGPQRIVWCQKLRIWSIKSSFMSSKDEDLDKCRRPFCEKKMQRLRDMVKKIDTSEMICLAES